MLHDLYSQRRKVRMVAVMYSVEFEHDASIITSMDEADKYEDVQMVIVNDGKVFLRQFEDSLDSHQLIEISYQQLMDLVTSLHQPEGLFQIEHLRGVK